MYSPEKNLAVALKESKFLKQYINDLPSDAWDRQSACDLWTVREVVTHLVIVNQAFTATITRGLRGISTPPEGAAPAGTMSASSVSERFHQGVVAARERLGDEILKQFNHTNDQMDELLSSVSDFDWEKPCHHAVSVFPVRTFLNTRVSELVMHGWDIRSPFETNARISPDAIPIVLELLPSFINWQFWPSDRLPEAVRYHFELTGPGSRNIDILIEGDKAYFDVVGDGSADVTFYSDTETFLLLMYGRLKSEELIVKGHLSTEGRSELAAQFSQWFKGT